MSKWQPIETAPRDGTEFRAIIPGYGTNNIIRWQGGLYDSNGEDTGGWRIISDQEPPHCWTDGICWAVNEMGKPSVQPTHWMPMADPLDET